MKTKILAFLMAVCMAAGVTACTTNTENVESSSTEASGTSEEQSESERSILEYNTLFVISKERIPDDPSLLDEVMEEKFGIVNHWEQVPSSSVSEKLNLLFASNDVPDYAWPVGITPDYPKRYGNDGLLLPLNDYFDQLPDYKALYTDAEWETMLKMESNADGKLYYLPKKNYRKTANAWIYRKSAFDEMGLTFPKTIDELYTVLKTIKENDPDSIPMSTQGSLNVLDGLCYAWGIDPDSPYAYVDENGELVGCSRATDEYREVLKFAAKLYAEGLINKEFATVTDQQWTETYANGKAYIQYSFATRETWAEENMRAVDPEVDWEWVPYNVTNDPDGDYYYNEETAHSPDGGPFFSNTMSEEKMDRLMEWYNWICTEEGALFCCMGEEGVTYEIVDGEPRFMSHMYHSERNPEGKNDWEYGLFLGNLVQPEPYLKEVGKEVDLELSEALSSDPKAHSFPQIAWELSESDEKKLDDYDTLIKDVVEEYSMKFIMGKLDPNNDTDWETYLKTLDGVGLQDAIAIRQANYSTVE